ncbi:tRNA-dihydrouridine synthase [Demequina activiva]|uniref:Diguanylate cyclase n=1 Tax=Demequina activiva TaxID=1582364 RepID=A0A919Q3F8_9MICO|nr:tRNA-dihydrouridine synthase [Demequina activiva]GIG54527.1 diguanylate cyclase [Demequina activiva]
MTWWFDPRRTYEDNVARGPFGAFAPDARLPEPTAQAPGETFLARPVHRPFGIAAGPLPTARHCAAAFAHGFDINVYKTVRSRAVRAHPFPHALAVRVEGDLPAGGRETLVADADIDSAWSISNSYGVPSSDPDVWQPDMERAAQAAGAGQLLVGSCQGTRDGGSERSLIEDYARTAALVAETGAHAIELNLSCPNEGTSQLVCHDPRLTGRVVGAVKERVGDVPVVVKIAYVRSDHDLAALVASVTDAVEGIAAVNTLPARLVRVDGSPALPGAGREVAGVCGAAIRWAGLEMSSRLARLRERTGAAFVIVGVGGVLTAHDYVAYRLAGADAVMAATGAMRDPALARAVRAVRVGEPTG